MRFDRDEAILLLRCCSELTARPHLFLCDALGGAAPTRPLRDAERHVKSAAATEGRGLWKAGISDLWNGPVRSVMENAMTRAYKTPLLGSLGSLLLILAFRPYRPPLRPFLSSRMPRLRALFLHSVIEWWEKILDGSSFGGIPLLAIGRALVALGTAALYYLLLPIDKVLGLPAWLGAVGTRFAILNGVRAAAGGAPGVDMIGVAFQPCLTATPPAEVEEVLVPATIEEDLERRLESTTRIDFRSLRANLAPARLFMLIEAIKIAFTDIGLLHAQYYQDPRIVDYVAQRIAGKVEPKWVEEPLPAATFAGGEPVRESRNAGSPRSALLDG